MKVFRVALTLALCLLFTLQVAYTTTDQNQRIRETERPRARRFLGEGDANLFGVNSHLLLTCTFFPFITTPAFLLMCRHSAPAAYATLPLHAGAFVDLKLFFPV